MQSVAPPPKVIFDRRTLIPQSWLVDTDFARAYAYNPTIARVGKRLLMAYRVDTGRYPNLQRRIALCELDDRLQVIPGSVHPFSDSIREGDERHYDPRFVQLGDRLFIHYNNGFNTLPNHIFLVEVDMNTLAARRPAQESFLLGNRQRVEKNWMFFEHAGDLFAVYHIHPHIILRVELRAQGPLICRPIYRQNWDAQAYHDAFGVLRGGASPLRFGDVYLSVFHSVQQRSRLNRLHAYWPKAWIAGLSLQVRAILVRLEARLNQLRYSGSLYAFDAQPPFTPRWIAPQPVLNPTQEARRTQRRINLAAEKVIFPGGAIAWDDWQILVAYGVHDERCVLRLLDVDAIPKAPIRLHEADA